MPHSRKRSPNIHQRNIGWVKGLEFKIKWRIWNDSSWTSRISHIFGHNTCSMALWIYFLCFTFTAYHALQNLTTSMSQDDEAVRAMHIVSLFLLSSKTRCRGIDVESLLAVLLPPCLPHTTPPFLRRFRLVNVSSLLSSRSQWKSFRASLLLRVEGFIIIIAYELEHTFTRTHTRSIVAHRVFQP